MLSSHGLLLALHRHLWEEPDPVRSGFHHQVPGPLLQLHLRLQHSDEGESARASCGSSGKFQARAEAVAPALLPRAFQGWVSQYCLLRAKVVLALAQRGDCEGHRGRKFKCEARYHDTLL